MVNIYFLSPKDGSWGGPNRERSLGGHVVFSVKVMSLTAPPTARVAKYDIYYCSRANEHGLGVI